MKRARFLELAQAEFNDAVAYLNEQVPELGEKFAQEAQRAVNSSAGIRRSVRR